MRENDLTILAPGTFIRGNLFSENILIIEGGVEGNIRGNKIIVKERGWVHGDVLCRSLSIEPGGIVDGAVKVESSGDLLLPAENSRSELPLLQGDNEKRLPILEDLDVAEGEPGLEGEDAPS